MQLVIFQACGKLYAFPSEKVEEITESEHWHPVPGAHPWVLGLINLRGKVLSLINFNNFLNKSGDADELCYNNTVVVNFAKGKAALAVDKVTRIIDVAESDIQMMEDSEKNPVVGYLFHEETLVNLLDIERLA